jgi:hypothetical protein
MAAMRPPRPAHEDSREAEYRAEQHVANGALRDVQRGKDDVRHLQYQPGADDIQRCGTKHPPSSQFDEKTLHRL